MGGHGSKRKDKNPLYIDKSTSNLSFVKSKKPRFQIFLPYRFDIPSPREAFYSSLDLDSWANAINILPEKDQMYLQRVSKGFYNLYWDSRREYSFDPNASQKIFSQITDETLNYLLSKCNKEYFSGLSLRYCFNTTAEGLMNAFSIRSLRKLDLTFCYKIQSSHLQHISMLDNLDFLNVTGCELLGKQALEYIACIPRLQRLTLCELPQIMTLGPIATGLTSLRELRVGEMGSLMGLNLVQTFTHSTIAKLADDHGLCSLHSNSALANTLSSMQEAGDERLVSIPIPTGDNNLPVYEQSRNHPQWGQPPEASPPTENEARNIDTLHDFGQLTNLTSLILCPSSRVFKWILLSFTQLKSLQHVVIGDDCLPLPRSPRAYNDQPNPLLRNPNGSPLNFEDVPSHFGFAQLPNLSSVVVIPRLTNVDDISKQTLDCARFFRNRETNNSFERVNTIL